MEKAIRGKTIGKIGKHKLTINFTLGEKVRYRNGNPKRVTHKQRLNGHLYNFGTTVQSFSRRVARNFHNQLLIAYGYKISLCDIRLNRRSLLAAKRAERTR